MQWKRTRVDAMVSVPPGWRIERVTTLEAESRGKRAADQFPAVYRYYLTRANRVIHHSSIYQELQQWAENFREAPAASPQPARSQPVSYGNCDPRTENSGSTRLVAAC